MEAAALAKEALKLPARERAEIIDTLWRSFDPSEQDAIDQAWLKESQDRLAAFESGQLQAADGEQTLRSIENDLRA